MSKLRDKGTPVDNVTNYSSADGSIVYVANMEEMLQGRLLFATKRGLVKLVMGLEFETTRKTIASTKLGNGDEVVSVLPVTDHKYIILKSKVGYFLRFTIEEISMLKKVSQGVRAMKLDAKDEVEIVAITKDTDDAAIEHNGHSIVLNTIKLQKRDAKGTKIR
jgi:DNA gyrase subunit A